MSQKSKSQTVSHDSDADDVVRSVSVDDFDIDKLYVPAIDEKRSSDTHYHAFPYYDYDGTHDKLLLTTGEIKITKGGIPRLDDKWRKTDAKREYLWLGIDETQTECVKLFNVLRSIDEKFDKLISYDGDSKKDTNAESKTVYFEKDKKKKEALTLLEYSPLIKLSQQGGDGEQKDDNKYVPYERVKLRFGKKYSKDKVEGEPNELTTLLFVGNKETEESCTFPSDYEKFLRWNCTARFVLQFTKFRCKKVAEKDKKGKSLPRDCAFDINMLHVYITKEAPTTGASNAEKYRKRFFAPTMTSTKTEELETKTVKTKDESSDDSSDEEKEPVKPTKEVQKSKSSKQKSESEESSSESEESEESIKSEDSPKKSKAQPVKAKKVNSDTESSEESDSEDESEDEKKKTKSKKSSR